ncbi:Gfo/Idh/MocA family oxidoreductase [Labrenzia sp. OB1]|uniref:Gfo/Idh/MocA family protein n=1 Tax=Labrenzia sp. OB1 TaxID=1561204 RepID=UPI0007B2D50B|nr:Gfo/Idh/MocA family oxidoreductase [Labrenzia sp. OB1]KZM48987.1 oxidoreductase [Labrenzia sp. OB1]
MSRVVKFGVIGCGLMGREFASAAARWLHLTDTKARPEIVAVCDTNTGLMDWFSDNLPSVTQKTTDYKDMLANPEVEAIYCALPHVLHDQVYPEILAAGKHLLGEKPFGMDGAANARIQAAIDAHPELMVRCSSEMPFYPGAQKVIKLAQSGDLGEIIEVEAAFLHSSDLDPDKPINWKRMIDVNGEYGCMGDLGMHVLHVPLRLGWKPARVSASLVNRFRTRPDGKGGTVPCETWDNATITGHVEDEGGGFPLVLKTWRISPGDSNSWSLRVLGTRKSACFTTKNPRQWQWMDYTGGDQVWQVQDIGFQTLFPAITGGIFEFGFPDALQQMWAAFLDELAGGDAKGFHCVTPAEAADHHAILTAALKAGTENSVVKVNYGTA